MKSLFGIGFNLVFVPFRIARKLGQDTAPCSKEMPDKAEISEVPFDPFTKTFRCNF